MRALIPVLILASATPAAAQITADSLRLDALQAQQQMDRQREVALHNEVIASEARARTEQNARLLERQSVNPRVPSTDQPAPAASSTPLAAAGTSIPDDRLAASQAAVRDAARNRR